MAEERKISIKFDIDATAAQRAKAFINDMTRMLNQLAQAATRAGQTMGGIGGKGTIVDRKPAQGFGNQTAHSFQKTLPGHGVTGMLSNIAGGGANELRGVASATQSAFQTVSSGLSSFVSKSESDINRLQRSVDKLSRSMSGLGGASGGGGGSGATVPGFIPQGGGGGGGAGPGAFRQYVGQRMEAMAGGLGVPAPMAQGIGGYATRFAGGVGAGMGIVAAYEMGAQAFTGERAAQVAYTLGNPLAKMQAQAAQAAPFQQQFAAAHSGDVASQVAFRRALRNKDFRASLENVSLQKEQVNAIFNPVTLGGNISKAAALAKGFVGNSFGEMSAYISGSDLNDADKRSAYRIAEEQAQMAMGPQQAAALSAAHQAEQGRMSPALSMAMNSVYQNSAGRINTMRMLGRSSKLVSSGIREADGSMRMTDAYSQREAQLTKMGYSFSDDISGHQQLLGVGMGYGRAVGGNIGLVSSQIAGLHNAASLAQSGGIMGGSVGASSQFMKMVQRSVGRGGLDVAAGSQLFEQLSQRAMASGQFAGSSGGRGIMASIANYVGGGRGAPLDVAEQQGGMRMMTKGMSAMGGYTQGTLAPLYQATSLMGAMGAMGGYGYGAEALTKMDPMKLLSIANGDKIGAGYAGLGITKDSAKAFIKNQKRAPLFEVVDSLVSGPTSGLLKEVRASEAQGGDYSEVFKSKTKGMAPKEAARKEKEMALQLGALINPSDPEAGAGTFLAPLAVGRKGLRGGGAHAAGPTGLDKQAAEDRAKMAQDMGEIIAKAVAQAVKPVSQGGESAFTGAATAEGADRGVRTASGDFGVGANMAIAGLQAMLASLPGMGLGFKGNPVKIASSADSKMARLKSDIGPTRFK